jgi:hypothetical protein
VISLPDFNGFALFRATPNADRPTLELRESAPRPWPYTQRPLKNWLNRRILEPLLALLRQGISARRLALCVAIAIVVGNIPVLGVSTILCALIALIFRLNLPAIQLVQAAMAPTQLLLFIPFVRLGEWMLGAPPEIVSIERAFALMSQGVWQAVVLLRDAIFHAVFAWGVTAPLFTYLLYRLLTPALERMAAQVRR